VLLTSLRLLTRLGLDAARWRLISGFINTYLRLNDQEQTQFQHELAQLAPDEHEATMELSTTIFQVVLPHFLHSIGYLQGLQLLSFCQ
jgi:type VI protein secretion system component VasA